VDSPSSSVAPVGYLDLVRRNPAFRRLWLGQVVSLLGDWFGLIASATLVARLTGSGLAVGGLFVARMLPPFLVSPVAGVLADRLDRRDLLIVADLLRAVIVLGFLLVREPGDVWLLYALTAIQLAVGGVFFPARNALLPSLVTRAELGAANALSAATWSTMLAFGAALGGFVAGKFGVRTAFVVDAATYGLSALILLGIPRLGSPAAAAARTVRAAGREYLEGLRYLVGHSEVLFTACNKGLFALTTGGALQVAQVQIAQQIFVLGDGGSTGLGLMYAVAGLGTGIGPIVVRRLIGDDPRRMRRAIVVAYALVSAGLLVVAPLLGFAVVLAGIFLRGLGGGINWVMSTQLLMMRLPDEVRGRVFSSEFAIFTLCQAVGTAYGGWALDAFGLIPLLFAIAVLPVVPGVAWWTWVRRLDRMPVRDPG
jgi:MFS family permease